MTKVILFSCLSFLISFNSYGANFFSNSLDLYECSTEEDAKNCTKCKSIKDGTMQVEVNVEKSVVLITYYDGSKNLGGGALEQCKVVNKKNWACGEDGAYDQFNNFSQSKQIMTNGLFYSLFRSKTQGISRLSIKPSNTESFTCAK